MINFFKYIRTNSSFAKLACDDLLFVEYKCPIKESKVPIWSEANYLAYVLSGKKIWSSNNESYELKEGDSIFVAKGAHFIEQIMDKEFCVLIFFFPDEFLEVVLEEAKYMRKKTPEEPPKFIPIEVNEPLQIYFQSMASLFSQEVSPLRELLSLKFKELIIQLLNYQKGSLLHGFFNSVTATAERKFRQMIENNLQFDLGIEEYAKMANMSVSTFKRYFKEVYGSSPGQYIINSRLAASTLLLKKSDKSIQEIAYETGFESAAHFTRMFNKKYKVPPSKFRATD
jgi:AraC-like DNA-binding protein